MKKTILIIGLGLALGLETMAQAIRPSILIRPGKSWCELNGYVKEVVQQDVTRKVYNFADAALDPQMNASMMTLSELFTNEGFEVMVMDAQADIVEMSNLQESMQIEDDGIGVQTTGYDASTDRVKGDFLLDVNWSIEQVGPKKQLTFTLVSTDAYTGLNVCSVTGTGEPSMTDFNATLLREAVIGKIPQMRDNMGLHMKKILDEGRTVMLEIQVSNASPVNLKSMLTGGDLERVITTWIRKNSKKNRVNKPFQSTRTKAYFRANIPLYDADGMPIGAEDFLWKLYDFLLADPYHIQSEVNHKGLGHAILKITGQGQ